jgi:hypothetical protein
MTGAVATELNSAMFEGRAIAGAAGHVQTGGDSSGNHYVQLWLRLLR